MIVIVCGNLDAAIQNLDRKMRRDGLKMALKVRSIAKHSERLAFKRFLSRRRKSRDAARKKARDLAKNRTGVRK